MSSFYSSSRLIIAVIFSFFLFSCEEERDNSNLVSIIVDMKKQREVKASEVYENILYIPLETTDQSIIPEVRETRISKHGIVIMSAGMDLQRTFFIFDRNGKFITKISRPTEGREKIIGVFDFQIYEGNLEVLDRVQGKIMVFDILTDELIESINIPQDIEHFEKIDDTYILASMYSKADTTAHELFLKKGLSLVGLDFSTPAQAKHLPVQISPFSPIAFNRSYLYYQLYSQSIHSVNKNGIELKYEVDMSEILPENRILLNSIEDMGERLKLFNDPKYSCGIRLAAESRNTLMCMFPYNKKNYYLFYKKRDNENYLIHFDRNNSDDIYSGYLPTLARGMTSENELVFIVQPPDLKDFEGGILSEPSESYKSLIDSLNYTDNPVIVLAKLRSDLF
jgi:hypothetical protein